MPVTLPPFGRRFAILAITNAWQAPDHVWPRRPQPVAASLEHRAPILLRGWGSSGLLRGVKTANLERLVTLLSGAFLAGVFAHVQVEVWRGLLGGGA
jgi:hypothetical protein